MAPENDAVLDRFRFHPATPVTGPQHDDVREVFGKMAAFVLAQVPAGRHQSLALTALQESMMWCNAAIACDTPPPVYPPCGFKSHEPECRCSVNLESPAPKETQA